MEEETGEEEFQKPRRLRGKRLFAVLVALILVGGVGTYFVFFSNQSPLAAFTYSAVDRKLSVSADTSSDPDGRIVSYHWDWGDQTTGTGIRAAHTYAQEGAYAVKLLVRDNGNAEGSRTESIEMVIRPTADFEFETDRMSVDVDGSLSSSETGGDITELSWDWGDGTATETGVRANHTYSTPGRYTITLTVRDASSRVGNTTRMVSPAATTVDVKISKAFTAGCPFESYWYWRQDTYGDTVLTNLPSCVHYYPWVLFSESVALQPINPSFLYTVYRRVSTVRGHPGYAVLDPVILPVNNSNVPPLPTSYVAFNLSVEYMGEFWKEQLNGTAYDPNSGYLGDGFHTLVRGNYTMDLTMSKRIFGVPTAATPQEAQAWWWTNTAGHPKTSPGLPEKFLARWLDIQGNGKYNIWEGFEWELIVDLVDLNGTVSPDGTTRIQVFAEVYGMDTLWMRWWYWGRADYSAAVMRPYGEIQPEGWAPEELCWCEHARMVGNITDRLDLDYSADAAYQWMAWANPGSDGTWNTPDDLPAWVYEPIYLDYVPSSDSGSTGAGKYSTSELNWWAGKTMIHAAPGSYSYGKAYEYILAATRYTFRPGYTLTIRLPQGTVPWYDPVESVWNPNTKIGDYVVSQAPITLRFVKVNGDVQQPGTFFVWDSRGKVLSFAGPYDYGGATGAPALPEPWVEMQPEAVG
jgi:hypothetical protein